MRCACLSRRSWAQRITPTRRKRWTARVEVARSHRGDRELPTQRPFSNPSLPVGRLAYDGGVSGLSIELEANEVDLGQALRGVVRGGGRAGLDRGSRVKIPLEPAGPGRYTGVVQPPSAPGSFESRSAARYWKWPPRSAPPAATSGIRAACSPFVPPAPKWVPAQPSEGRAIRQASSPRMFSCRRHRCRYRT